MRQVYPDHLCSQYSRERVCKHLKSVVQKVLQFVEIQMALHCCVERKKNVVLLFERNEEILF